MRTTRFMVNSLVLVASGFTFAQTPTPPPTPISGVFTLENSQVKATIEVDKGVLKNDGLATLPAWAAAYGPGSGVETDSDFALEVVWTDWNAPGKANNADNLCRFTKADFQVVKQDQKSAGGSQELVLTLVGPENLGLEVRYILAADSNVLRRQLRVFDPTGRNHFLNALSTLDAEIKGKATVVKAGGFGQPIALTLEGGGVIAGLEWPSADNQATLHRGTLRLRCSQEMGELISTTGVTGETVALVITPDSRVKYWFGRYVDSIRIAKLRPYTLYNSWYDLRSADYPRGVKPERVMNETNITRIIGLLRENMIKKHGITLDAFVLDDGWDLYDSDWVLRPNEFPKGLTGIVEELKKTNTRLGIWFGPTGGYSARKRRVGWMKEHGYEVAGDQMWVAGPKYSELFKKRTGDFAKQGVAYYKWDGFQFLASDPSLGTPTGIFARRATLKKVDEFVRNVRTINPDMFLNITSGTWLSPWWLKYADQIWMDGGDYGEADVPSISTRDSSISYRDLVLFEDFKTKNLWFPISNLMTHGVLKGTIDVEGIGKGEPLTKFADEVVFYLARGVTMYELYISPDILSEGEWNVLSEALRWARENFSILSHTEMIGGDPNKVEPYGYAHFDGNRGILALRNPGIAPTTINVQLDPALGLDRKAASLVLERIYPTRWVSPRLFAAGDSVDLPLLGYEAAVYELRPLAEHKEPVLADVVFEKSTDTSKTNAISVLHIGTQVSLLNSASLKGMRINGRSGGIEALQKLAKPGPAFVLQPNVAVTDEGKVLRASFTLQPTARLATFAVLLKPDAAHVGQPNPVVILELDGKTVEAQRVEAKGVWTWITTPITAGSHEVVMRVTPGKNAKDWSGSSAVWITGTQAVTPDLVEFNRVPQPLARVQPPTGRGQHELPTNVHLGDAKLGTSSIPMGLPKW